MAFINELPADEILDLLDKYVEEEYGHEASVWSVEIPEWTEHIKPKEVALSICRFRFQSDEEI